MGYLSALDMAAHAASLDQALLWHLQANHFPPLPACLVNVAEQAIEAIRDGDYDRAIPIPNGIRFRGARTIRADEAAQAMHLDAFLSEVE